ncbi:MAG: hypothetical protein ACOYU0_01845 [Nitrospirota bacterium]
MGKYTLSYEVEIEAEDIAEAEEMAWDKAEELKKRARLRTIEGSKGESSHIVYEDELKFKRK